MSRPAADTVLTTPEDVTRYEAANPPPPVPGEAAAISIPTGVFISLVELTGPYTVEVSGQFWQRYADNLPKDPTFKLGAEDIAGWMK